MSRKNTYTAIGFLLLVCLAILLVHLSNISSQSHSSLATSTASAAAIESASATSTSTAPNISVVNGMTYEIVTTPAQQQQGLGGRSVIPDNYGMLFVFPKDGTYGFWMKDMLAPLDMTWISANGTIVAINRNVPANSYPYVYYPPEPIRYVIETKAGYATEKGWHVGMTLALPAPY